MAYQYRYQYNGDLPTVFIHLQNPDGSTWLPSKGDTIDLDEPVYHPLLQLISNAPKPEAQEEFEDDEPDVLPELSQSPVTDDDEEN